MRLFGQWVEMAQHLAGPLGVVLLIGTVGAYLFVILSSLGQTMGRVLRQWGIGYSLYLLIFFTSQTSTFRLLLPLFPHCDAVCPETLVDCAFQCDGSLVTTINLVVASPMVLL